MSVCERECLYVEVCSYVHACIKFVWECRSSWQDLCVCVCVCVCTCHIWLPVLYVCVCAWGQADMWFTLAVFDVSIGGLSPPTSALLFDLHQSGPDHSAFVYFQRHFSFLLVSLTPAHPLSLSLSLCVYVCVCVQVRMSFVLCADVCQSKMQKSQGCFTSVWLSCRLGCISFFFSGISFLLNLRKNITYTLDIFLRSWLEIMITIWRQTLPWVWVQVWILALISWLIRRCEDQGLC